MPNQKLNLAQKVSDDLNNLISRFKLVCVDEVYTSTNPIVANLLNEARKNISIKEEYTHQIEMMLSTAIQEHFDRTYCQFLQPEQLVKAVAEILYQNLE